MYLYINQDVVFFLLIHSRWHTDYNNVFILISSAVRSFLKYAFEKGSVGYACICNKTKYILARHFHFVSLLHQRNWAFCLSTDLTHVFQRVKLAKYNTEDIIRDGWFVYSKRRR
jgi:hypothetical protein